MAFFDFKNILPLQGPFPLTSERLLDIIGGPAATSGARVTTDTALTLSAVWRAVSLIAATVGSLPLPVYERTDIGKEKAINHPLYRILHDEPNPWMTSMQFRETLQGHVLLTGNGYAEIERDRWTGDPVALWPLRPDSMERPVVTDGGKLLYRYRAPDGTGWEIPQYRIFHLRGLSTDGLMGLSPITVHREGIGLALATREYGSRFFSNNAQPGGVLQAKGKLTKDAADRMSTSWNAAHQGLSKAHRIAVLEEGVEFKAIALSNEDSEYLGSRTFDIQEVARMFGVAPHKLFDLSRATFSNIEAQKLEFETDSVRAWVVRWEQQIRKDLFLAEERDRFFAEHNMEGLLRADSAARAAFYGTMRQWSAMTGNDIRDRENLNRIEGNDDLLYPSNMAIVGQPNPAVGAGQGVTST